MNNTKNVNEINLDNDRTKSPDVSLSEVNSKVKHFTDASFESSAPSEPALLLDFWASWCGPCKMIAPILEEIALDYGNRLCVAKINIDDNPQTPTKYGVRGIPTLILFKNGIMCAQKVGALSKSQLSAFIDAHL